MEPSIPAAAADRHWAELPWDTLSVIFDKIGVVEILVSAQAVCKQWRKLALEPRVWLRIDITGEYWDRTLDLEKIAAVAVERSDGHLVEFAIGDAGSDELLKLVSERASGLKQLRLVYCDSVSDQGLIEATRNLSSLELLEISYCSLCGAALGSIGRSCPKLATFRLNGIGVRYPNSQCNAEALTIARNMPGLRELQIFGNRLDREGLHALLEGCPNLETLDLRHCFQLEFDQEIRAKCARLKSVRFPKDSTDDYPHDTYYVGSEYDTDNDYDLYGLDDFGFLYEGYHGFAQPEIADLLSAHPFFGHYDRDSWDDD